MKRFLILSLAISSLYGCSTISNNSDDGVLARVDDIQTGAPQTMASIAEVNGRPALLYSTQTDDRIVFQYGDLRRTVDDTARVRGGNRPQLHLVDKTLLAMWWSHENGKNLYSTVSDNLGKDFSTVSAVNESNGVLPPPSVLRGPDGTLGAAYLDEREVGYQFYVNRSIDSGRTWAKRDQRLDTRPEGYDSRVQEPQAVKAGSTWVAVWADTERVAGTTGYRIMGRRSENAGLSWLAPMVIYRPQKFVSALTVRAEGDRVVIAFDERGLGIKAIASVDQGRQWHTSSFQEGTGFPPTDEGASNSGIDMNLAGDRAHLVWMEERAGNKVRVMRGSLEIAQAKWITAATRLDIKAVENTKSILPVVQVSTDGVVWAAWVDYRDIRPNIYVSTSSDQGMTWTNPEPLLRPGEVSAGMPKLLPWKDGIAIGYELYPNERELVGKFVLRTLTKNTNGSLNRTYSASSDISESERIARLQTRVKAMWDFRLARNYDSAYDFFDFAYKAATPKKYYLDNAGALVFQSYSVQDAEISGNVAAVKLKFKYEVPPTTLPSSGKPIKLAPFESEATHTWVWVGNDWYFMFAPAMGQPNLKY